MDLKVHGTPAASNAPKINGPISGDGFVNEKEDDTVEISGTAQPGASVEVSVAGANNVKQSATAATGTGSWKVTLDMSGVSEGAHSVNAVATLPGGTASPAATANFIIDRTLSAPRNIKYDGGDNIITETERADGVIVSGDAERGATLKVTVANTGTQTIQVDDQGHWKSTPFTIPAAGTGQPQPYSVDFEITDKAGNGPQRITEFIQVQGPTQTPAPPAATPITPPATTPTGPRSTTANSLTTDDEGSVASSADNAADATTSGAAGTTSATPGTAADAPASTGPTVAGKSLSSSGTTALAGNHGSSKLSLSDLLDQGSHDMPELQGAPSAGQSVVSTAAASSSATVTSTTAGAGETGSTIVSNPVATVNTLLASQQPWEHQPTV